MVDRILDRIECPADLRPMTDDELVQLANEIRRTIIKTVGENGGHLASNLGVVEITLALHRVLDSPNDKIIWDTSNQTYPHKLVTGRAREFETLRKPGGLSGFAAREESAHDVIGAGHAGTGVSAGVGIALASRLRGERTATVTVIGDGSFTAGVVFEALNQAGDLRLPFVVLLNDNGMSISPNVGAISRNLRHGHKSWSPKNADIRKRFTDTQLASSPTDPYANPKDLCAAFGFEYVGPVDGHDRVALELALQQAVDLQRPVLVHSFTRKGKGLNTAETDPVTWHQPRTGQAVGAAIATSYSKVMARTLAHLARTDNRIVAVSAAMMEGTALTEMQAEHPGRVFDVGIAEAHGVALAAGMATQGLRPVVCIYSTFLQRAFDQIVHDVAIQRLPVIFGVDRAGIVGDDGRTHHGVLDLAYLRAIPNLIVAAPKDENELRHMLRTALAADCPFAIRYSRGAGIGTSVDGDPQVLPVGRAELIRDGSDIALLGIGWGVTPALQAAEELERIGLQAAVVNARFVKPLDRDLICELATRTRRIITVEDHNKMGGFGSAVVELLTDNDLGDIQVRRIALPDEFHEHGPPDSIRAEHGITVSGIVRTACRLADPTIDTRIESGRLIVGA